MVKDGVDCVPAVVVGEIVVAGEVGLRTHVEVIVFRSIEYGIERCGFDYAYRTWGKAAVLIGVVRRIAECHVVCHAAGGKITGREFYRRVGLKEHILAETVEIEACNDGPLVALVALFLDNRGESVHLFGRQTEFRGFFAALVILEFFAVGRHFFNNDIGRRSPVEFVSVGQQSGAVIRR